MAAAALASAALAAAALAAELCLDVVRWLRQRAVAIRCARCYAPRAPSPAVRCIPCVRCAPCAAAASTRRPPSRPPSTAIIARPAPDSLPRSLPLPPQKPSATHPPLASGCMLTARVLKSRYAADSSFFFATLDLHEVSRSLSCSPRTPAPAPSWRTAQCSGKYAYRLPCAIPTPRSLGTWLAPPSPPFPLPSLRLVHARRTTKATWSFGTCSLSSGNAAALRFAGTRRSSALALPYMGGLCHRTL
jgi:hypothetical protein